MPKVKGRRPRSISFSADTKAGHDVSLEEPQQDLFSQAWYSLSSLLSFAGMSSSGHEDLDGNQEDTSPKPVTQQGDADEDYITFTCTSRVDKTVHHIKICGDQSFEDFMDLIQNEFGQQLWATYTDLLSGKAVLVKDDDSFDIVCDICEAEGDRLKLDLTVEAEEPPEYDSDD